MNFKKFFIQFFGTTFYTGYSPKAPGTVSSIFVTVLYFLLTKMFINHIVPITIIAIIVSFALSMFTASFREEYFNGQEDPKEITMDEFCGVMITMLPLAIFNENSITFIVIGLILFRIFDILKPSLVGYFDKNFPNNFGITMDDVVAGMFSSIILLVLISLKNYL